MKRLFNLKKDKPDHRDFTYIDFNKHIDTIKYLINFYVKETQDTTQPIANIEYVAYFLNLSEKVKMNQTLMKEMAEFKIKKNC